MFECKDSIWIIWLSSPNQRDKSFATTVVIFHSILFAYYAPAFRYSRSFRRRSGGRRGEVFAIWYFNYEYFRSSYGFEYCTWMTPLSYIFMVFIHHSFIPLQLLSQDTRMWWSMVSDYIWNTEGEKGGIFRSLRFKPMIAENLFIFLFFDCHRIFKNINFCTFIIFTLYARSERWKSI